ncbi:hypothetical protein CCP3SC5AM1_290026 [Gammaproteobacteria bacterium]
MGGDLALTPQSVDRHGFNPRPPRGGRSNSDTFLVDSTGFQSAPPAWGAIWRRVPPPPCGHVSIRAPRVGGDISITRHGDDSRVSIRAPRVGGDIQVLPIQPQTLCFNPRPPRGGRCDGSTGGVAADSFQSAPPAWGAINDRPPIIKEMVVSIRAPRVGGDLAKEGAFPHWNIVSIRAPRVGGDIRDSQELSLVYTFQSAPPAWGAIQRRRVCQGGMMRFNPRPPRGGRCGR